MKKKFALAMMFAALALVALLLFRTLNFQSRQLDIEPVALPALDANALAVRLAGAVAFPTISHQEPELFDKAAFMGLHRFLADQFPRVHSTMEKEVVGGYSLLYTWQGKKTSAKPVILLGHLDVVPVEPGSEDSWEKPPFSGLIEAGYIWGRGTLDDKVSVLGALEACEHLIAQDFQPTQTIYLAFGHDEEIGGLLGAKQIAGLLESRGVEAEFVLDEGMIITEDIVPGIRGPVGLIGIAEKGYLSVELSARSGGGHSSQPPAETAVGSLAKAIHALESNPMPARLDGAVRSMFDHLGPEMPFGMRMAFANTDLLSTLLVGQLSASPATNAAIRTTAAPTMLSAGIKDNVLPREARAVVNFRILPGDTVDSVLRHVRAVINNDQVSVTPLEGGGEASPLSPINNAAFEILNRTIRETVPGAVVAPALVLAGTDSKHYAGLTRGVYRFLPLWLKEKDLGRIHGSNERIAVDNYSLVVSFYIRLLENAAHIGP